MRKIKEVLRLKWGQGLSNRQIAQACGIARPTVSGYLLAKLNAHRFKKLTGSRRSHFEQIDPPVLRPLPAQPYCYAE